MRWCDKWLVPKYTSEYHNKHVFLTAKDCYQLRCSLIHSGAADINPKKVENLTRIVFCSPTIGSHCNLVEDVLQLRADMFSSDMYDAVDGWDELVAKNVSVQSEKSKLLVIHEKEVKIGLVRIS